MDGPVVSTFLLTPGDDLCTRHFLINQSGLNTFLHFEVWFTRTVSMIQVKSLTYLLSLSLPSFDLSVPRNVCQEHNLHQNIFHRLISTDYIFSFQQIVRQRLRGTGSVWNRYEIGTDKPCDYTGSGGTGTDRICHLAPNGSTYEGDPMRNRTVPV